MNATRYVRPWLALAATLSLLAAVPLAHADGITSDTHDRAKTDTGRGLG